MPFTYQYCDHLLFSSVPIPELPGSTDRGNGFRFELKNPKVQQFSFTWTHHWMIPSGKIALSHSKDNEFHWLRFPELADFRISPDAFDIKCFPLALVPVETILHLLLDQVLPRCLAHQGNLMLHSSAVSFEQGALLFIGGSGAGKSTLAGNFHQAGFTALADDCVWLTEANSRPIVIPSYGGLRLWEDSLNVFMDDNMLIDDVAHYSPRRGFHLHNP